MTVAERVAKHRKNAAATPWARTCDCGRRAVKRKSGSWVCADCLELERKYYGTNCNGKQLSIPHHHV